MCTGLHTNHYRSDGRIDGSPFADFDIVNRLFENRSLRVWTGTYGDFDDSLTVQTTSVSCLDSQTVLLTGV